MRHPVLMLPTRWKFWMWAAQFKLVVLCSLAASSEDFVVPQADFAVEAWTTKEGLPQSSILAMAQTPDGYLWLGTFNGLARFDGVRFTVYNPVTTPALRSARILSLYVDRKGALWIVAEDGSVTRLIDGRFEAINGKMSTPNQPMVSRGIDPTGNIWLGTPGAGCWRQEGDQFVPEKEEVLLSENLRLASSSARTLWLPFHGAWRIPLQDSVLPAARRAFEGRDVNVVLTAPARDGDVWLISQHFATKLRSGLIRQYPGAFVINAPTDVLEDNDGNLLIGTWTQGALIFTRDNRLEKVPLLGGHSALAVRNVMLDSDGNRWIGTDIAGLQRLKKRTFRTFMDAARPLEDTIRSVTMDGAGNLWTVTPYGADRRTPDGSLAKAEVGIAVWWAISADKDGEIWLGALDKNVCRIEGLQAGPSFPVAAVHSMAPAEMGGVWVGTEHGLWHVARDLLTPVPLPDGATNCQVRALLDTPEGLWVGATGLGFWRKQRGEWTAFGRDQGLTDNHVASFYADADHTLWVGTTFGGLHRWKNGILKDFRKINARLPIAVLCIAEDDLGYLWLGSMNGIFRVSRRELNAVADGLQSDLLVQSFDRSDGLETVEMSEGRQPTVVKGRDGRIWFATINGLSVVDPKFMPDRSRSPTVRIEDVSINDEPMKLEDGVLEAPPLPQRVNFRYTGINLADGPRVRFKRRLEGLENDWVDVGVQRNATYYNLPPGSYHFHVMAANEDGVWSKRQANLDLRVLPAWWQSAWFRAVLGLALVSAAASVTWFRFRVMSRKRAAREAFSQQLIESQELERRRISAELHDGLGHTLLVVKHQASLAVRVDGIPEEAAERMRQVSNSTQAAIEEVRGIVKALRPALLDSVGLNGALSSMLQKAARAGNVKLVWNLANMDGALAKKREIELFRVVQEALNNVIKHSLAANARIELRREPARWILEISDDGCGFNVDAIAFPSRSGGLGLNGMRERVRIMGGTLTVASRPGEGTLLKAEAPIVPNHER